MLINWTKVENSSNIDAIAFDDATNEIIVVFKSGSAYAYNPGKGIFAAFTASKSKGKFVHDVLREGSFPLRKLDATSSSFSTTIPDPGYPRQGDPHKPRSWESQGFSSEDRAAREAQ